MVRHTRGWWHTKCNQCNLGLSVCMPPHTPSVFGTRLRYLLQGDRDNMFRLRGKYRNSKCNSSRHACNFPHRPRCTCPPRHTAGWAHTNYKQCNFGPAEYILPHTPSGLYKFPCYLLQEFHHNTFLLHKKYILLELAPLLAKLLVRSDFWSDFWSDFRSDFWSDFWSVPSVQVSVSVTTVRSSCGRLDVNCRS